MKTTMNKAIIALAIIGFFIMPLILAEESSATDLSGNPGTLPDESGYGLKLGLEKVGLWFTFNQEKKAAKEIELARLRLLEAKAMAEKGNLKAMEKAQAEHDKMLENAQRRINKIQGDTKEQKIKETAKKLIGIQRAIEAQKNRIEVLKDILAEKNLSEEQKTKLNEIISKFESKTAELSEKVEGKKEQIKTKLLAVTQKSEEDVNKIVDDIETEQNLTEVYKTIADNRIKNAENAIDKLSQRVEDAKTKGLNASFFESQIELAKANIESAKALYNEGKYKEAIDAIKPLGNYGRNMKAIMEKVIEAKKANLEQKIEELRKDAEDQNKNLKQVIREKIKDKSKDL